MATKNLRKTRAYSSNAMPFALPYAFSISMDAEAFFEIVLHFRDDFRSNRRADVVVQIDRVRAAFICHADAPKLGCFHVAAPRLRKSALTTLPPPH